MNKFVKVLVGIAALVMIYLTVMSILTPVRFDKEQKARETLIQKKLKSIASLQQAYEGLFGKYADASHLRWFLQEGKIYYINAEGEYTDEMRDKGLSERSSQTRPPAPRYCMGTGCGHLACRYRHHSRESLRCTRSCRQDNHR